MKELMERCGALCRDIEGALGVNAVAMDVSDMPDLPACACAVSFCNRCKELPLHPHRYGLNLSNVVAMLLLNARHGAVVGRIGDVIWRDHDLGQRGDVQGVFARAFGQLSF